MPGHSTTINRWSPWLRAWTALSLPGLCLAILMWEPSKVVGIAAAVACPLALVLVLVEHGRRQWDGRPWAKVGGWIGRVVLCGATFLLSCAAVGAILPGGALLLLLVAGATTPPATDLRRRVLGQTSGLAGTHREPAEPHTPQPPPYDPAEAARAMTDTELCRAWRQSFWTLREAQDPLVKMSVVSQRQCFLDELETRNAEALDAWLASDARPSGGPDKFLKSDGDEGGGQPTAA